MEFINEFLFTILIRTTIYINKSPDKLICLIPQNGSNIKIINFPRDYIKKTFLKPYQNTSNSTNSWQAVPNKIRTGTLEESFSKTLFLSFLEAKKVKSTIKSLIHFNLPDLFRPLMFQMHPIIFNHFVFSNYLTT